MPLTSPATQLDRVRDRRINRVVPLVTPRMILHELPLTEDRAEVVLRARHEVAQVLNGGDDRLLVIVGPCSVHDVEAGFDYAQRLAERAEALRDDLLVVMRVYFEKPRTTTGWKGLINDPHLDQTGDVNEGLRLARKLLLDILGLGLPVSDTVAWGAIGARTTESQIHRQLASGLSMPVGFKNGTDGNVKVAVDAVRAAAVPHAFSGIDESGTPAILHTTGNQECHIILRGGRDAPNYSNGALHEALAKLREAGLPERVVIDASHDNSGKDHVRQREVAGEIAKQVAEGERALVGVMLESFLVAGRQDLEAGDLVYGQSITDACMAWDTTVEVLDELAAATRARRGAG